MTGASTGTLALRRARAHPAPVVAVLVNVLIVCTLVAGLCALIRSKHKGLAPAEVKAILERTADKTADMAGEPWNEKFGFGRINALKAVSE